MSDSETPAVEPETPVVETVTDAEAIEAPAKPKRKVPVKLLVGILVPLVVLGSVGGWAATHTQFLTDQYTVWNYETTAAVDKYTDDSTMTDQAMFLFTASKPRIAADSEFDDICGDAKGGDGALGCYTAKNKHITLFEIADERLEGLQDAVASHLMLHAVWDRMSESEREPIEKLLDAEANRLDDDKAFNSELLNYRFGNNDERRFDELHSIIATEVLDISPALEAYYAKYFTDRDKLVGLYTTANNVLVEIAEKVEALEAEIDTLNAEIDADFASYQAGYDQLELDVQAFNDRNEAYFYHSQAVFDADRNALFARADALDAQYAAIEVKIDSYTDLLADLTELDAEAADLFGSINLEPRTSGLA